MQKNINIKNKKARFEYELLDKYTAGIVLGGTEIKSLRYGKASISESFCEFNDRGELFVINMQIDEYSHASHYQHKTVITKKGIEKTSQRGNRFWPNHCSLNTFHKRSRTCKNTNRFSEGEKTL